MRVPRSLSLMSPPRCLALPWPFMTRSLCGGLWFPNGAVGCVLLFSEPLYHTECLLLVLSSLSSAAKETLATECNYIGKVHCSARLEVYYVYMRLEKNVAAWIQKSWQLVEKPDLCFWWPHFICSIATLVPAWVTHGRVCPYHQEQSIEWDCSSPSVQKTSVFPWNHVNSLTCLMSGLQLNFHPWQCQDNVYHFLLQPPH